MLEGGLGVRWAAVEVMSDAKCVGKGSVTMVGLFGGGGVFSEVSCCREAL